MIPLTRRTLQATLPSNAPSLPLSVIQRNTRMHKVSKEALAPKALRSPTATSSPDRSKRAVRATPAAEGKGRATVSAVAAEHLKNQQNVAPAHISVAPAVKQPAKTQAVQEPAAAKLARELSVPKQIRSCLEKGGVAIVSGVGYTGKSEMIALAAPGYRALDIKSEFLKEKFNGEIPDEAWDNYQDHKDEEVAWLQANRQEIIDKLVNSEEDTILIDEVDYHGMAESAVLDIIQALREADKKVIIILHPEGLDNTVFIEGLEKQGHSLVDGILVETGWLNPAEEEALLETAGYTKQEIQYIMDNAAGNPTVYIDILKAVRKGKVDTENRLPPDELLAAGRKRSKRMIAICTQNADVANLFRFVYSPLCRNVPEAESLKGRLSQATLQGGSSFWTEAAARIALSTTGLRISHVNQVPLLIPESPYIPVYVQAYAHYNDTGHSVFARTCPSGHTHILLDKDTIRSVQTEAFQRHGKPISELPLPTDAAHPVWWEKHSNTAKTVEELQQDAERAKGPFLSKLRAVAGKLEGVEVSAGKNDEFAVKGIKRMKEKAAMYMEFDDISEDKAVGQLNDPLRATIVIKSGSNTTYADVAKALHEAFDSDEDVDFHVFMNKFENSDLDRNQTGYGAVHIIMVQNLGDGKKIYTEIQIHHEDYLTVKDGPLHAKYEITRAPGTPQETTNLGQDEQATLSNYALRKILTAEDNDEA